MYLEDFSFFTKFHLSEITDTAERYEPQPVIIEQVGSIENLVLTTAITYPIQFDENETAYRFRAGVVIEAPGLYWLGFSTASTVIDKYEHPVLNYCKGKHRTIRIAYMNQSATETNYQNFFLQTEWITYLT